MGGRWIRLDALLHDHPRVAGVGPWGLVVLQAAWRLCKAHGYWGDLPAAFWTPAMFARWSLFGPEYYPQIREGMDACEAAELIVRAEVDGKPVFTVRNWRKYQVDDSNAQRQARFREQHATLQNHDTITRYVTASNAVTQTLQNTTGQDTTDLGIVPVAKNSDTGPAAMQQVELIPVAAPGPVPMVYDYDADKWSRKPTPKEYARWKAAYPAVDIDAEFMAATIFLRDTPGQRKRRFARFLANWFARSQSRRDGWTR